jgi:hypothetical protein
MHDDPNPSHEPTDLDAARRDVEQAGERLSSRWRAAKVAGERSVSKALSVGRPVIVGVVLVGGAAWLVSSLMRSKRRGFRAPPATERSVVAEMARAAALALASTAARRLAERYLVLPAAAEGTRAGAG